MPKYLLYLLLTLAFCLSGCSKNIDLLPSSGQQQQSYTVRDLRGKEISFPKKPERIASSFVYADEILLDLVEHQKIAGVSKWVHDPGLSMAYKQAADVQGIVENNLEAIVALKPDLLFVPDTAKREYIDSLEEIGIKVYVFKYISRLDEIPALVRSMGAAVGENEQAEQIVKNMQARLAAMKAKVAAIPPQQRRSALLFLRFGAIGGAGCIYNDIMTAAGIDDCYEQARPVTKDYAGTSRILSKEEVIKTNPEFLLLGSWSQGGAYKNSEEQLEEIYNDPAYAGITAIQKRQAVVIPQSYVNCLSHHAAAGIEKLYAIVYENTNGTKK